MTADDLVAASLAASTRKAYAGDIAYYQAMGYALPATPADAMDWLVKVASKLKPATIQRRMISLHGWHKERGLPSPIDARVKKAFSGLVRTVGAAQRAVKPLVRDDLLMVVAAIQQHQKPVRAARDIALLLLMFSGALRRHSVVDVRVEDLTPHQYGMDLYLPKSKTDQLQLGTTISIPYAIGSVCPVRAVENWRTLAGVDTGYLFRSVSQGEVVGAERLHLSSVARIVKQAVALSGRDPSDYSSHSARAGFVTTSAAMQRPLAEIAQVTQHRGIRSLQKYLRVVEQRRIPSLL
jgi:integrase